MGEIGLWDSTSIGTCSQQVHNILVVSQVTHDLQLRHESLLLICVCRCCKTRGEGLRDGGTWKR